MKSLFLSIYLTGISVSYAQGVHSSSNAAFATGVYSQHFKDAFAQFNNPAALTNLPRLSAGVYTEKKFLLDELNHFTGAISIPVQNDGLGITASWMGYSGYNESVIGMGYGKNLGKISLGIQCNYTQLRIAGYGNKGAISFTAGSLWQLTEKLVTSILLVNSVAGKFSSFRDETLPAVFKMGLGYTASEKLLLCTEFIKEEDKPVAVHAGLQYVFDGKLFTRLGIISSSSSPYFGVGWKWKNIRADILAQYHTVLGISPGLQLIFFSKKGNEK